MVSISLSVREACTEANPLPALEKTIPISITIYQVLYQLVQLYNKYCTNKYNYITSSVPISIVL